MIGAVAEREVQLVDATGEPIHSSGVVSATVLDMEECLNDTRFEIGELIEIEFRDPYDNSRRGRRNSMFGYVADGGVLRREIILSKAVPKFRGTRRVSKRTISGFRRFPLTGSYDYDCLGQSLAERATIGTIVEVIKRDSSLKEPKYAGYVTGTGSGGVTLSMSHPSNRREYHRKGIEKVSSHDVCRFRILGHRPLW